MTKFNEIHMHNIRYLVESATGTDLTPARPRPAKRVLLAAALIGAALVLASCARELFTPLAGDELALSGSYAGGVLTVQVTNGSEKNLTFQNRVKLYSWDTGEEIAPTGEAKLQNRRVGPHSASVLMVDLSGAYPMGDLERTDPGGSYYVLLTNNGFQFGHDWICSFRLPGEAPEESVPQPVEPPVFEAPEQVGEDLRFYFEKAYFDSYSNVPEHGVYLERVQALLAAQPGYLVSPVDAPLAADDPAPGVIFDESVPAEEQYQLVSQHDFSLDTFRRLVAAGEPALELGVTLPQYPGQRGGGVGGFGLLYFFAYPTAEIQKEGAYTFAYGNILTFPEMEKNLVYQDEEYTVYDLTDLFHTDPEAYLEAFYGMAPDFCLDEQTVGRVRAVYDYYRNRENLRFHRIDKP